MVVQVLPSEEDSQVQVTEVTAPSGSEREALSAESTRGVPGTERAPASSALVTLMVTSMVSSAAVSALPPASFSVADGDGHGVGGLGLEVEGGPGLQLAAAFDDGEGGGVVAAPMSVPETVFSATLRVAVASVNAGSVFPLAVV